MSEAKKASQPQGKASKKSKGERASGGRVPRVDCNAIEHALLNPPDAHLGYTNIGHKAMQATKRALALVRRAGRHQLAA